MEEKVTTPFDLNGIQAELERTGLIDPAAFADESGFDGGRTKAAVVNFYTRLTKMVAQPVAPSDNELAMMMRMLISALKRRDPESTLPLRATKLLHKYGLLGSPLRGDDEPPPASTAPVALTDEQVKDLYTKGFWYERGGITWGDVAEIIRQVDRFRHGR